MSCEQISEYMMKYFDHELTEEEKAVFDSHIGKCEACKTEFETMSQILECVNLDEIGMSPDEGFEDRVMKRVTEYEVKKQKESERTVTALYTAGTVGVLGLIMFAFAIWKEIYVPTLLESLQSYFKPVRGITSLIELLAQTFGTLAKTLFFDLVQACGTLSTEYGYAILGVIVFLFAIQSSYKFVVKKEK